MTNAQWTATRILKEYTEKRRKVISPGNLQWIVLTVEEITILKEAGVTLIGSSYIELSVLRNFVATILQ